MDGLKQQYFTEQLVRWYRGNKRDLPWRRTNNPYHIWVSEIMLQQTRVDTVIPYYERFISKFPTIAALAEASEAELLKIWEGLGYYSRVRNMQIAARQIEEEYGGVMPDTREEISKLRGIGPYTAGAVLSIAYGKPEPAVDGNVLRVVSRYFLMYDDIAKPATRVKVEQLISSIIPEDAAADFNQALMELGALVCTPRAAKCGTCPVSGQCSALLAGAVEELPVKTKAKKPRCEERAAFIVEGTGERQGQIMLRKRPDDGLLARMWELPNEQLSFDAQEQFGLADRYYMDAEHVFSHIKWQIKVYTCREDEMEDVVGLPVPSGAGGAQGDDGDGLGSNGGPLAVAESASAYEAEWTEGIGGSRDGSEGSEPADRSRSGDVLWVSRHTWTDIALPNVFIRILRHYFADGR